MKKILLLALVAISLNGFAQTVWNFSDFATSAGIGADQSVFINGLGIHGGSIGTKTDMGVIEANSKTFTSPTTTTNFTFTQRFKFNGGGYSGAAATDVTPTVMMPTQRYLSFQVTGNSNIYAIGVTGSNTSTRTIFVTDGSKLIGSLIFPGQESGTPPLNEALISYTGDATTLYVFCNAAVSLFYLSATNVVVSSVNNTNIHKTVVSEKLFDVLGREVNNKSKGLIIKRQTYDDGTTSTFKTYIRSEK